MAGLLPRPKRQEEGKRGVPFLSPEWCDLYRKVVHGVPGFDGATATFENIVRKRGGDTGVWTVALKDGLVVDVLCGPSPDADFHTEFSEQDDYACYLRGDTRTVNDAYWKGTIAVSGDIDAVVAIAPVLDSAEFKAQLRRVHDETDFS
jgi:hypothetical protein